MDPFFQPESGGAVARYLAIMNAAEDFGARPEEVEQVACLFDTVRPRDTELADALADIILSRTQVPSFPPACADGGTF
jgi:hypothetical protein